MDDVALATLCREMHKDCEAALASLETSVVVFAEPGTGRLAGCGHYVARFFNIIEQMALRVAKAFENNIDDERGWHTELIRRLNLDIPEIRPALFSDAAAARLQHLRGFRHIFAHAYDLEFDPRQLELQLDYARGVADELPASVNRFIEGVAAMHGLAIPPAQSHRSRPR